MAVKKINRAVSISQLKNKKFKKINLTNKWEKFIGTPEANGVWFVWGNSGHGKSRFLMMLAKELTKYGKVAYNTLEEAHGCQCK
jgi:predicted ATP-dependent serine protease